MQDDSQAHDVLMQDDKQAHESKENDKQLKQGDDQFGFLYGAEYDENGNLVTSENGGYYENQANDEYEKMYGAGKTDANGNYIMGSGGFYTNQAAQDRLNAEEDWEKMYGDLQYDKDGNIIGGGYYNKQAATDRANEEEDWEKMYGAGKYDPETGEYIKGSGGFYTEQNVQNQANWQAEFDREGQWYNDAQEAAKPTTKYEGEGALNGQDVPKQLAGTPGLTTTNPSLFDDNGYFKQAAVVGENANGSMTYNIGGKEVSVKKGTSPYTNTQNPDAANGTFDNGYQPDNVGGKKLTELKGEEAMVNGQWVPIYTTPDGKEWVYDAANNEYFSPTAEQKEEEEKTDQPTKPGTSGGIKKEVPLFKLL